MAGDEWMTYDDWMAGDEWMTFDDWMASDEWMICDDWMAGDEWMTYDDWMAGDAWMICDDRMAGDEFMICDVRGLIWIPPRLAVRRTGISHTSHPVPPPKHTAPTVPTYRFHGVNTPLGPLCRRGRYFCGSSSFFVQGPAGVPDTDKPERKRTLL